MTTIGSGHHHSPASSAANALSGMGSRGARASQSGATTGATTFPEPDAMSTSSSTSSNTWTGALTDGSGFDPTQGMGQGPGMPPPDDGQNNGFSQMGMDTQSFAMMMSSGMPPPPPPMGGDGDMVPIESLDTNQDGNISRAEFGLSDTTASSASGSTSSGSTAGTDDAGEALFSAIDSDQDGSLSAAELNSFKDKLDSLFSQMQEMGGNAFGMTPPMLDITA